MVHRAGVQVLYAGTLTAGASPPETSLSNPLKSIDVPLGSEGWNPKLRLSKDNLPLEAPHPLQTLAVPSTPGPVSVCLSAFSDSLRSLIATCLLVV